MKAQLQLVEVFWIDAASIPGWQDPDDLDAAGTTPLGCIRSVGYLSRWTRSEVQIIQSRYDETRDKDTSDIWAGVFTIPRGQVWRVRSFGVGTIAMRNLSVAPSGQARSRNVNRSKK